MKSPDHTFRIGVFLVCLGGMSLLRAAEPAVLWAKTYVNSGTDEIKRVCGDKAGNVYVTGYVGGFSGKDCMTIKYNGNGTVVWANRFTTAGVADEIGLDVGVDGGGNVYVTGKMLGSSDFLTLKYNSDGIPLWTNRYDGFNQSDGSVALALDALTNVFVTGSSYQNGSKGIDYVTIKYAANGSALWTNRYEGPGFHDSPVAIAVNDAGDVYVTGYSEILAQGRDYLTIKYSSTGVPLWTNRYNGNFSSHDAPVAMALDSVGNVYVTGTSANMTHDDYATVKYSPSGNQLWVRRYNGVSNGQDFARAIAIDSSGNVYVTGQSYGGGSLNMDYLTVKYAPNGNELWTRRYNSAGSQWYSAAAVEVDDQNHVYVTGGAYAGGGDVGQMDIMTIKYAPDGAEVWTNRQSFRMTGEEVGCGIAVLSPGEIVIAANVANAGSSIPYVDDWAVFRLSETPALPSGVGLDLVLSNGAVTVTFIGSPWLAYVVERTDRIGANLWQTLGTNQMTTNASFEFIDFAPLQSKAFYRLRQE